MPSGAAHRFTQRWFVIPAMSLSSAAFFAVSLYHIMGIRWRIVATVSMCSITFCARRITFETRLSSEEEARHARYAFFERERKALRARWVLTAHHADDQAETVLLRLLRGAGTTGLGAMRPVAADGLVRPMLAVRRSAIEAYAVDRDLQVHEDPTNRNLEVPRNRVRHELLPLLEGRYNPRVVEGLMRTARGLQADDDYLDNLSRAAAQKLLKVRRAACVTLDTAGLRGYHIAVQRRVLRQYIQELVQRRPIAFAVVEGLLDRLAADVPGMYEVTGGIWAQITGADLILRRGLAAPEVSMLGILRNREFEIRQRRVDDQVMVSRVWIVRTGRGDPHTGQAELDHHRTRDRVSVPG